jgi:hypothetical protein
MFAGEGVEIAGGGEKMPVGTKLDQDCGSEQEVPHAPVAGLEGDETLRCQALPPAGIYEANPCLFARSSMCAKCAGRPR